MFGFPYYLDGVIMASFLAGTFLFMEYFFYLVKIFIYHWAQLGAITTVSRASIAGIRPLYGYLVGMLVI